MRFGPWCRTLLLDAKKNNDEMASEVLELVEGRLISVGAQGSLADALYSFGSLSVHDVFHSIHLPLPSPRSTGSASRILTVHDVLHLRRPDLYENSGNHQSSDRSDSLYPG